jgi:hypothetical protein
MKQAHKGRIEGHPSWINILDRRTLDSCSACRMLSRHSRNPGCSSIYMANRCELAYWRFRNLCWRKGQAVAQRSAGYAEKVQLGEEGGSQSSHPNSKAKG